MNIVRDIDFNWHYVKFSVRIHEYRAHVSDPWFLKEHIVCMFVKADLGKDTYRIRRYEYKLRIYLFECILLRFINLI